jgi:hypothetical protein
VLQLKVLEAIAVLGELNYLEISLWRGNQGKTVNENGVRFGERDVCADSVRDLSTIAS